MTRPLDLTGLRFGKLVAQSRDGLDPNGRYLWKCVCDCGTETTARSQNLVQGGTKSCGCLRRQAAKPPALVKRHPGKPCITCGARKDPNGPKGAKLCASCAAVCLDCKTNPREPHFRRCKDCIRAYDRRRMAKPKRKKETRLSRIVTKYKVSREKAAALMLKNRCEAGERSLEDRKAHVDHCHTTGLVRGVLCFNCNAALGHLKDSEDRLKALIDYLQRTQPVQEAA
jgi:hypothetical protein